MGKKNVHFLDFVILDDSSLSLTTTLTSCKAKIINKNAKNRQTYRLLSGQVKASFEKMLWFQLPFYFIWFRMIKWIFCLDHLICTFQIYQLTAMLFDDRSLHPYLEWYSLGPNLKLYFLHLSFLSLKII